MDINYSKVAEQIFTTLVGLNFKVESFDNSSEAEIDPRKASKFVSPQLVVNLDRDQNIISVDIEQSFSRHPVIKTLKNLSLKYGLDFDYKVIGRSIRPKRESIMSAVGGVDDLNLHEVGPAIAAIGRAITSPAGKAIATQVASKLAGAATEYGLDKLKTKMDQKDLDADVEEAKVARSDDVKDVKSKPRSVTQRRDLGVGVAASIIGGREVYTVFQIVYVDPSDPAEVKKGPFRTYGKYKTQAEAEAAGKKLASERGVEFFTPKRVGQRQVTEGVFDLADLILENNDKIYAQMQDIAKRIGDREEVAAERRRKIFHPEEFADQVRFSVSSDKAQYAVTSRWGDLISQDEDGHFVAPRKIWSKIEQTAYDADGVGAEEIIDEGKISKFLGAAALSAAMALPGVRAQAHDYSPAANQQPPAAVQQVNVNQEVNSESLANLKDMVAKHQVKDYATLMQAIEQSAKQAVEDVWGTRQNFDMVEQVQKNTEIQVMKIIAQQQGQKYPSGNMNEYIHQLQNWANGHQVQETEEMDEGKLANLALAGILATGIGAGGFMAGKHSAQAQVSPPGQHQQVQTRDPWQKVHQDAIAMVKKQIKNDELGFDYPVLIHKAVKSAIQKHSGEIKDNSRIMSGKMQATKSAIEQELVSQYGHPSSQNTMDRSQSMEIDTFENSDPSGIFHAAKHLNKSFLVKAEMAQGGTKTFRVKAQSERVAREKFSQHHAQAVIQSVKEEGMAEGSITEDNKQPALSKYEAYDRLEEIYNQITVDDFTASPEEAQGLLADAKRMYKITGSRFPRYSNTVPSAGYYYNEIYKVIDGVLGQHGQREFPSAANVKDFAKGIAAYYHGDAKWQKPIRWQNSSGGSRQDPEWTVVFEPEHMDDVWQDLSKRGKTVYISGSLSKTPQTYLQFGSILVGKDASITGPFSDNPERTDFLTFQSAKILRNDYYTKHDITPQQAHQIQDIAKTKNQNAQDIVRAIARALNEPKMDKALARVLDSTRIDPAFKAKLNQIIAGAKDFNDDFKEGMAEGKKKSDRYHIVGKDGKPANLASYADRASAIEDRDKKYPGAVVQQVGPRGKVKGVAEGKYDPAKDTFNPETHTAITKDGVDKIIPKGQLAQYKTKGWKERHSLKAFHKNREKQGVAEGSDRDRTVHISKDDWTAFEDWMESEGLGISEEDGIKHNDLGDVIELVFPPANTSWNNDAAWMYASEWDVRDQAMKEDAQIDEAFKDDLKKLFGIIGLAGTIGYGAWLNHLATYDTPLVHEIVRQAQAGNEDAIKDLHNISLRDGSTVELNRLLNKYGFRSEYERKSPEPTMERSLAAARKAQKAAAPMFGSAKHGNKPKARMPYRSVNQDKYAPAAYDEKKAKTRKNIEDYFYRKEIGETMEKQGVTEGFGHMLGSSKTSYQPLDGVKIIVRHKAPVAEEVRGSRSRNIKEIFIQRGDERFKMRENSLQAARAMARHVHSGGEVYDQIGKAINEMATEQKALANFVRFVSRSGMVNETNQEYVDLATKRVQSIRETFRKLMGPKTYANAVEHINNEVAVELTETDLDLESKFTSISCDQRVTNAVASMRAALARQSAFESAIQEAINKEDFGAIKHRLQEQDAIEFENATARLAHQVSQLSNVAQDARLGTYLNNISKKIGEGIELEAFETKTVKLCLERAKCKGGRKKMESLGPIKESKSYAEFIEKFDIF